MAVKILVVESVSTAAELSALADDWRALAAAHGEGLPFRTWEWNDAWWKWFGERRFAVRDELFVRTFRTNDGKLVGVAPLVLVRRPGVGVPVMRGLEFFGADPYVTELRGALVNPAWERHVYRALGAHLEEHGSKWDWIRWQGIREESAGERLLKDGHGVALPKEVAAYRLPLEGTWDQFRASRSRNMKESLRKCYNSLKRDGHAFELHVVRAPKDVPTALARFFDLHARRAATEGLVEHGDVFEDPASRGFLLDVCERLAQRDAVRIFELRIGGAVVASRIGFALGSTLYLYFSGYDPAWARYSVMTTTVAEAIRYAIAEGFALAPLSPGTDESKLRWRPARTIYREGVEYVGGVRGWAARFVRDVLVTRAASRLGPSVRHFFGRGRRAKKGKGKAAKGAPVR